jgi:diguanylate cyclase
VPSQTQAESQLLRGYLAGNAVALAVLWFIPPGMWLHAVWQTLTGWAGATFMLVGVRRFRPRGALAWYLIAAGLFVNSTGVLVEMVAARCCGVVTNPGAADACWLALFPGLIVGLAILVYRRAAVEDLGTMLLNTSFCVLLNLFVGIFAWELIVWRTPTDPGLTLASRLIVTVYPLADLLVLALMLRLWLGVGLKNVSVILMMASLACFLASDIGWSSLVRAGAIPAAVTQYLMDATGICARALMGAAALHPAIRDIVPPPGDRAPALGRFGWVGLLACALVAPLVILLQAVLDHLYSVTSL